MHPSVHSIGVVGGCLKPQIDSHHHKVPALCDDGEHRGIHSHQVLWFSSWAALFSSFLLFVPYLPSWVPFLTPIITIFLSWNLSHSLYAPSNPYAVPCITARQGIFFASLFLVMDTYSSSRFSHIGCILLLLIFFSMIFHDFLLLLSGMFYLVLQYSFAYSAGLFLSI